nr:ATP-binding protein [Leifsonia sp. Leaf325]
MPEWIDPSAAAERVLELAAAAPRPATVLIDGPSGSGKSTFADRLVAGWAAASSSPALVRLDSIYPGWSGLDAASVAVAADLLVPRADGLDGGWRRWDWTHEAPAEWHEVAASQPLIVEGCGTLSTTSASVMAIRVWIEASDAVRKPRALDRDAGAFDAHWDEWDAQWRRYVEREHPSTRADVRVRSD